MMCFYCLVHVGCLVCFFFLMMRRPPRSTQSRSSAASDVYKRQVSGTIRFADINPEDLPTVTAQFDSYVYRNAQQDLSLIHISEPTRLLSISYAVFCLKKKKPSFNPSISHHPYPSLYLQIHTHTSHSLFPPPSYLAC